MILTVCVNAFAAIVSGSTSTALSHSSGGTTFRYRASSTTSSAMKPWRPLMPLSV